MSHNIVLPKNHDGTICLMKVEQKIKALTKELSFHRGQHFQYKSKFEHHHQWAISIKKENENLERKKKQWVLQESEFRKRIQKLEYQYKLKVASHKQIQQELVKLKTKLAFIEKDNCEKQDIIDEFNDNMFIANITEIDNLVRNHTKNIRDGEANNSFESNSSVSTTFVMSENTSNNPSTDISMMETV